MARDYEKVLYYSKEDSRWLVEVPELAGCMADGHTPEEALKNADIIIDEWIQTAEELGREIPEPVGRYSFV